MSKMMNVYWMTAKRNSLCAEYETEITQGDRVVYDGDEYKAYCAICGEGIAGLDPRRNHV